MKYEIFIYVNSDYHYKGEINLEGIQEIEKVLQDKSIEYIKFGPDNNDRTVFISKANINLIKINKIGDE